jgi:hypothetical protein
MYIKNIAKAKEQLEQMINVLRESARKVGKDPSRVGEVDSY